MKKNSNKYLLLSLGLLLASCSSQPTDTKQTSLPIPVLITEAGIQDVSLYFDSLGTLKPASFVEIRPQANGMLESIHFTEGKFVQKGDLLFTIDSQSYAIKLQEAEAILAQNKASLESSKKKLQRYHELAKKDLIPQQEWEELQATVAKGEAQVNGDEARVNSANLDLQRCMIKAPIEGKTGKALVHPGNLVSNSQSIPLTTLSVIDPLIIDFTITEKEYSQLTAEHKQGSFPIEICSFSNPKDISKASLTFLDHTFDAKTGLLHIQATLANSNHQFLPGQHVKVRIPIQVTHNAITIPQKAVKINQKGFYVFLVKADDTVEMRQITLGDEEGDMIIVANGLSANDKVVTDGHLRLSPGLKVEIKKEN